MCKCYGELLCRKVLECFAARFHLLSARFTSLSATNRSYLSEELQSTWIPYNIYPAFWCVSFIGRAYASQIGPYLWQLLVPCQNNCDDSHTGLSVDNCAHRCRISISAVPRIRDAMRHLQALQRIVELFRRIFHALCYTQHSGHRQLLGSKLVDFTEDRIRCRMYTYVIIQRLSWH